MTPKKPGLPNDCFAHNPRMMGVEEATALLKSRITAVVGMEEVAIGDALGRVLGQALQSPRQVPGFDNAAVDGYAIAYQSLESQGETRLRISGRASAGHPCLEPVTPGAAVRILTGAMMPAGADTVIMQEDVTLNGDEVIIPQSLRGSLKPGANRRLAGEDIARGRVVLDPGHRLRPQDIGSAVSMGFDRLWLRSRLKVALLSTGDEIVEPGQPLGPGGVYDANRHMLAAMLQRLGHEVSDLGLLPDRRQAVQSAIARAAASHHAVITSGGASKGDEDHVVAALREIGKVHFWQLAIKPGRPLAFGQVGESAFIGLPGNPVAAALCLGRFVRPMLNVMAGGVWLEPVTFPVPAGFAYRKKPGRREWLRVRLTRGPGGPCLENFPRDGSGILTSLVFADGFAELDETITEVSPGDPVAYLPFAGLGLDF